ncbi:chemotaxis protein CheB [Pontiella sulfatireligans]
MIFLLRSLASNLRERAVCIVLSGTGTDGTLGFAGDQERAGHGHGARG